MTTRRWIAIASLVALCIGSTATNLGNQFTQDDAPVIQQNEAVHSLAKPWVFFSKPYWPPPFPPALYRPLSSAAYAVEWVAGAGRPWVFRVASNLLYLAAGLAFYRLALAFLSPVAAWVAAAFFMIHPVHVEAVAVAVNQSEIAVGLLAALIVMAYLKIRRSTAHLRFRDGAVLFGLYLTATLFKESGLVLLGLLVAAELTVIHDERPIGERLARIRPLLLTMLLGATVFVAIRSMALRGDTVGTFTAEALAGQSMGGRALTMLGVVPHWFRLLLWPAHLQGDYSPREIETATGWGAEQTQGALLIGLWILLTAACWKKRPVVSFGLLWAAIGIFPVSNVLVPTGIVLAERTLFLPSLGMMLAIGGLAEPVIDRLRGGARPLRFAAAGALATVVIMGLSRSASRQRVWHDQMGYWNQTVIDAPLSYRAHHARGELLFAAGLRGTAEREIRAAMYLYPKGVAAAFDLADKLRSYDFCDGAVKFYRTFLRSVPESEPARLGLIACLLDVGRYDEAAAEARHGVSYGNRPSAINMYHRLLALADSAKQVGAEPKTVRITVTATDTLR